MIDFGIRGLDLAYALMDQPDLTILLDATRQGAAPGSVYTIEPDTENLEETEQTEPGPSRDGSTARAADGEGHGRPVGPYPCWSVVSPPIWAENKAGWG